MTLTEICISLDLAKRLKELNVKQESHFYHFNDPYNNGEPDWVIETWEDYDMEYREKEKTPAYSAFTASELLEILPPNINSWGLCLDASSTATEQGIKSLWSCTYADYDKKMFDELSDVHLANLAARVLIRLIENGLIDVKGDGE